MSFQSGECQEDEREGILRRPAVVHRHTDSIGSSRGTITTPKIRISDFEARKDEPEEATPYQSPSRPTLRIPEVTVVRSSSLLQRLTSLRSPASPIGRMLSRRHGHGESYKRLDDSEGDIGGMLANVDLSSLTGPSIELAEMKDIDQPKMDMLQSIGEEGENPETLHAGHGLGGGMVIGAMLNVGAALKPPIASDGQSSELNELQRAKTIRERGQQEAEKRQVIVAVSQPVDLSSYEGMDCPDSTTQRVESTYLTSKRSGALMQSYFYPEDPSVPNWKPFSMRPFYITLLILISIALAGTQEWLYQRSVALEKDNDAILQFDRISDVSSWSFFCWKYLPTIIFVTFGVLWQILDFDVRRLEPFRQLSNPRGSPAEESLNIDYMSTFTYFIPIKAIRYKQWAVVCSSLGFIIAGGLSATLQNPSVIFVSGKGLDGSPKFFVRIHKVWSRLLSSSLFISAIIGIILLFQLRRKSDLLSDPKGIAGIASMATRSHILNDFQGLDTADERTIHARLRHRRYVLYKSSIWQGEYIEHSKTIVEPEAKRDPHPTILRIKTGYSVIGFLLFFLAFIPIINFTKANVIPDAAPWLPVLLATFIKMIWSTLEFSIRMIEPFYILHKGWADPAHTLTLDYRGTPYGILPVKALLNRHILVALVGFCAILTDVLTVTVSSFSVNGDGIIQGDHMQMNSGKDHAEQDETLRSFWASLALSILILAILISTAVLVYWRRGRPFLPRQPNTISSVLAFIFSSHMLFDFVDTETFSSRNMEGVLKAKGKKYGLGVFSGFDKKIHIAIDEMPWRAPFELGKPYAWVRAPWETYQSDEL